MYTYAIQSKIIYHRRSKGWANLKDGYYKKLKHWVGKTTLRQKQVDLLLAYANGKGHIPLYMLYNYVDQNFGAGVDMALYGCTVVGARYLKDKHTASDGNLDDKIRFSDLHAGKAFPWHELVCMLPTLSKEEMNRKLFIDEESHLDIDNPVVCNDRLGGRN
jgi:hypothetical protein